MSCFEANLELLRLRRQARLEGIALQRIEDRPIPSIPRWRDLKGGNQPQERGVQFAVRQMGAYTHS